MMLTQLTFARAQEFPIRRKLRSLSAPPFRLLDEHLEMLKTVHRLRVLDRHQAERVFEWDERAAQRRLRNLYLHGYLESLHRKDYAAHLRRGPVYRLAARGAKLLAEGQGIGLRDFHYWRKSDDVDRCRSAVSNDFLEHMVTLADIRIAMEQAAEKANCRLEVWRDDVELRRQQGWDTLTVAAGPKTKAECVKVTPDGYFVLKTPTGLRGHFFIEADRGTESIKERWRNKIFGYKALWTSGIFHRRYQAEPTTTFRVLVTTPTKWRAENIKTAIERYGTPTAAGLFLLTPITTVMAQDVLHDPIWARGGTTAAQALL